MKSHLISWRARSRAVQRAHLLDAAEAVFGERGFDGARMERVADRAGCAVGTLYNRFDGKSELYATLLLDRWGAFLRHVTRASERAGPARARIERFVRAQFEFMRDHGAFFKLYLHETRGFELNVRAALGRKGLRMYDALLDRLAALLRRAKLRGDPLHLAAALQGMINAHLAFGARRSPPADAAGLILRTFFFGCSS